MIKASIIGATGYVGIELIRILAGHPAVTLVHLVSQSFEGQKIGEVYPHLAARRETLESMNLEKIGGDSDVIFTALPHGASAETIQKLAPYGKKIIDLSADFRYDDVATYEAWYKVKHPAPELMRQAVYGLPELHRAEIQKCQIVGNPGCYTTCSILGLAPAVQKGFIDPDSIIIDAKSGVTGAGRKPSTDLHFSEVNESFKAYGVGTHRHTSEIEQEISKLAGKPVVLSFSPHLIPIQRGILATIYARLTGEIAHGDFVKLYQDFYEDEPFVQIEEKGLPQIKYVKGTNLCRIGFVVDPRTNRVVIVSVIDNLVKGAAGQAVENMNLLFGLPETTGLDNSPWYL